MGVNRDGAFTGLIRCDDESGTMLAAALASSKMPAAGLMEPKWPVVISKQWEFVTASGGPGRHRGDLGWNIHWRFLNDVEIVSIVERTKDPSWGQAGAYQD